MNARVPSLEELIAAGEVEYVVLFPEPVPRAYAEALQDAYTQGVAMGKTLAVSPSPKENG